MTQPLTPHIPITRHDFSAYTRRDHSAIPPLLLSNSASQPARALLLPETYRRTTPEASGRKAKLAHSYQELLDEFSTKDLKSVGNYTLGRLIGKGSFGKVYLANHKLTNGSKVVLKSANKSDANLAREIHHHRQFVHPHIARLYEVIVTESLVWMVLEYCPGDELYNYLLKHGPLPVHKVQRIFAQLVGAVAYVHANSCVHRDLKLENILFDKNENVKLVDFGFTREYEGKANHLQTFCGTICYSAPEMLKGEKYAGEKVDVWSLGVILYALLCGELPFDDDDDNVTRTKILTDEPKYPDHIPADALSLIKLLLSKRPLLRPSLSDVLNHPFLAEHSPNQQAILKVQQPAPFSTALEREVLQRMRSAGVDIDHVIESVLSQRCDALAGWWTLLLEKEERKARRRERKRREKEAELRSLRRLSAASSRLERMTPVLHDVREEGAIGDFMRVGEPPRTRGRSERRSAHYADYRVPDLPLLAESSRSPAMPQGEVAPPPIDKDSIRGSTLHLVTTSDALQQLHPDAAAESAGRPPKVRKRPSQAILATWKNWTHWIFENTRRSKSHNRKGSLSTPDLRKNGGKPGSGKGSEASSPRPQTGKYARSNASASPNPATSVLPPGLVANGQLSKAGPPQPLIVARGFLVAELQAAVVVALAAHAADGDAAVVDGPARPQVDVVVGVVDPLDPPPPSLHSKASSTSSNGSVSTAMSKSTLHHRGTSPHHSVKVLPATPTHNPIPSNIRLVRGSGSPAPLRLFNEGMPYPGSSSSSAPGSPNPFASGGVMFAKRKRNLFKGPMLNTSGHHSSGGGGGGAGSSSGGRSRSGSGGGSASSHSRSASASGLGRRSGEITIQEVDEDDEDEDEYGPGRRSDLEEHIEEHIFDEGEVVPDALGLGLAPAPTIVTGLAVPKG
ncbi:unnamed protein product [Parascedosporium putredinis]|uniref:Protein kinase domain-containing protein n=1 Tax=Parascedosporium putredinis TaxID=1442378 RepID=A0A9P1MAS7_9PEZI|nr:unnamed protein product [Parascedosporium putredinis]CAI7997386.1 unnamed protein product [Parascedosporium putredinis]